MQKFVFGLWWFTSPHILNTHSNIHFHALVDIYRENTGLIQGNGKVVWGEVMRMELPERGGVGGLQKKWKQKRGQNIQMADWDLVSWVWEKVTETNGFLCLVWLRGCTKPEIMCWYLQRAAWRWLIIISGPKTVLKSFALPLSVCHCLSFSLSLQGSACPRVYAWIHYTLFPLLCFM